MQELFSIAEKMQEGGDRESITDLAVCYLLSSTLTGNYEVRLDLYDRDFYLDEEECCIYWEPEFLTKYLKEDIEYFKKEIRMKIPQMKTYEIQEFTDAHRNDYMLILMLFFRQMLSKIFQRMDAYRGGNAEVDKEKFRVIFGEYMGNYEVLYGEGGEEL